MNPWLYAGSGLIIVALAQLTWAISTKAPTHFYAQGLLLGELGLMALAKALIANQSASAWPSTRFLRRECDA